MDGNNDNGYPKNGILARIPTGVKERLPGISGGVAGGLLTALFIVIPVIQTWLANTKEVSLAQIKASAEQIAYITQRMADSDKERDLYKNEMLSCQKELRELKK